MKNIFRFRFAGALIMFVMLAVFGFVVMLLWNGIMPGLFGFPALNYWRAIGILLLARILFGGLGPGFFRHNDQRNNSRFRGQSNKLREKWMNMSEEERKEFIEKEKDYMMYHSTFHDRFSHFNRSPGDEEKQKKEKNNE